MPINFNLKTDKAVNNLGKLSKKLTEVKEKLGALDTALKDISADTMAKKVTKLSTSFKDMQKTSSQSNSQLKKQKQVISDLKSKVSSLTVEMKRLERAKKSQVSVGKELSASDLKRVTEQQRIILSNKRFISGIQETLIVERQALILSKASLDASNKRAKVIAEFNVVLGRSRSMTTELTNAERLELAIKKENLASTEKLIQSQARLVGGKLRETEVQRILNEQKIREEVLKAKNNRTTLRAIALAELDLSLAIKEAEAHARNERGIVKETKALNKNTIAKQKATVATKSLTNSIQQGNVHAAEFRAGLSALGANFGIFTGSTIVAAATVFAFIKSIREAIVANAEFDFSMDRAEAVMAATALQSIQLRGAVRELAATTVFTARQVSEGLIFLGQAGQSVSESLSSLEPTLRIAQIGMIEAAQAADLTTNIMAAFNVRAEDMISTVDLLSTAVTNSNTNIVQLAQAISFVGPAAQATGTDLRDTAVILGFFADNGVKASRAGTALRRGIANLSAPTNKIKQAMFELGISAIDPTTGRMKSMIDIIKELSVNQATLQNVFDIFGKRAGPAFAAAILGDSAALDELHDRTEDVTNATARLVSRIEDNQISNYRKALAAGEEALISFGGVLSGVVEPTIVGMTKAFRVISFALEELETPIRVAGSALLIFGSIKLGVIATGWIAGIFGLTKALVAFKVPMLAATLAVSSMSPAAASAALSISGLGLAIKSALGPITILASIGIASYFALSSTEAERFAKVIKPLVLDLDRLKNSLNLVQESGIEGAYQGIEKEVVELLKTVEKLQRSQGQTFGEELQSNLSKAQENLEALKQKYAGLIVTQLQTKFFPRFGPTDEEVERVRKAGEEQKKLVDAMQKLLSATKGLSIVEKTRSQISAEGNTKREMDEENQAREDAIIREEELANAIERTNIQINKSAAGTISGLENQRKANSKLLDETRDFLLKKLGIEEINIEKIQDQLATNLKNKEILYSKTFKNIINLQEGFQSLLAERSKGTEDKPAALVDVAQLEDTQNRLAVLYDFKDYQDYLDFLESGAALEKEIGDQRVANARVVAARLNAIQLSQLGISLGELKDRGDKELELIEQNQDRLQAKLKAGYDARLLSLSDYINSEGKLITQSGQEEINVLTIRLLELNRVRQAHNEEAKKFESTGNIEAWKQEAEAVKALDEKIRELTKTIDGNKLATQNQLGAINQLIDTMESKAIKAATSAIVAQDAQINRNKFLAEGFLSVAEANVNYTIAQLNGLKATRGLTKEQDAQLIRLTELEKKLRDNAIGINGLAVTWDAAANTMAGKAVQSAKSMQGAFVEFFLDPTKDGFDGLLDAFSNMILKMSAERAVQGLFNEGGLGDFFTETFGKISGEGSTGGTEESVSTAALTTAVGVNTTALGVQTAAEGVSSAAQGVTSTALGLTSTALGLQTTANGLNTTALGILTTTGLGPNTLSLGLLTSSNGILGGFISANTVALIANTSALATSGIGGFFADGGNVKGNVPIIVGEKGPEVFVPSGSGTIVPNRDISKSSNASSAGNVTFENTVQIIGDNSNKEEIRIMVKQGMDELESKIIRQQQRTQRTLGVRR